MLFALYPKYYLATECLNGSLDLNVSYNIFEMLYMKLERLAS